MPIDRTGYRRSWSGVEGFTLLEVLVAFVICALALGGFLQVFSTGLKSVDTAEDTTTAILLAESKLAEVGSLVPLDETEREGRFGERFRWYIVTSPLAADDGGLDQGPLRPYRVTVAVAWGPESGQRRVEFTSLRLAARD